MNRDLENNNSQFFFLSTWCEATVNFNSGTKCTFHYLYNLNVVLTDLSEILHS